MEAATQQGAGQGQGSPKLKIDKFADGQIVCLKFGGTIDEEFDGKKIAGTVKARTLVLDLAEIIKISSFGIREWVDFVNTVGKSVDSLVLLECAPKVVDQLNMVANFAGKGKVFSFYAPYRCDYCDSDSRVLMQVDRDWEVIKSMKPQERPCASCNEPEYFDEDPTSYFSYIASQDRFDLEPEVAAFLSAKLNYTVSDSARRLRVDKVIEGRSTYLKLAGDLDGSFPRDKLAEGMEGVVILDVSGVGKIDPAGAAEWRGFLQMITPGSEAIYLLGVPPGFLEKLTRAEDLGAKAQVVTFAMPYSCARCATTASQVIDVEQHYDVLKFATPPEMKCSDCRNPTVCAATEGLLSHLPTLPKPSITPQTRRFIKEVQERKPEKKAATTVAEAAAQQRRGGLGTILAAAAVAAALAVGGVLGFYYLRDREARAVAGRRDSVGRQIQASAAERPAWITSDTRFSSYCSEDASGLSCVGVSGYVDNQDDARVEAQDAALEGLANAVGLKIEDDAWSDNVRKLYGEARQAALNSFESARGAEDGKYEKARREVREGRSAVAAALKKTGGGAVPAQASAEYWEEYQPASGTGSRFLVFVQYRVPPDQAERLVDNYARAEKALGAGAVTVFPAVAWRYPDISTGAIITALGDGDLKAIGLAERYIVTSIQDRQVKDAESFARIVTEEVERLKREGGNLKLVVKTGDTLPVEFNKPVSRAVTDTARPGGDRGGSHETGRPGNFTTWDRAGGNQGSRDDPTQ